MPRARALLEYLPFILLLLALFTVAGGIVVTRQPARLARDQHGAARRSAPLLASLIGTTGASMVMIRPLLRANDNRRHNVHVVVFFIFLVSNIGGSLTPLGDPPLFLGFLRGVDFFWTTTHLFAADAVRRRHACSALFFALDSGLYRRKKEPSAAPDPTPDSAAARRRRLVNFALIGVVIAAILMSAAWKPGIGFARRSAPRSSCRTSLRDLDPDRRRARFAAAHAAPADRAANGFSWGPILEVAKLFAGIFVVHRAGARDAAGGPERRLRAARRARHATRTGTPTTPPISGSPAGSRRFLDNAPTYLVFFELAGGDPQQLMTAGALDARRDLDGRRVHGREHLYRQRAELHGLCHRPEAGVGMPSFFGYMLWSGAVLIPVFVLATFVFFR